MDEGRDDRPERVLESRFPRIAAGTAEEWAAVFEDWRSALIIYAQRCLGDRAAAEAAVDRLAARFARAGQPGTDHALRRITRALGADCHALVERWRREGRARPPDAVPVDRFFGPVEGRLAEAASHLPTSERDAFLAAAQVTRERGRAPGSVRVTLARARKRLRAWKVKGPYWWALLGLPRRGQRSVERAARAVADAVTQPGLALMPLMVASWASGANPAITWAASASRHMGPIRPDVVSHGDLVRTAVLTPRVTATSRAVPAPVRTLAPPRGGAAAETPDDVRVTAAATPPGATSPVVAVGHGETCGCPVLLQSLDGGVTWAATDGPPSDANQLIVPPDYPRDPRIFAGVNALSVNGSPYMAAAFGAPFQRLVGAPAGQVALSSHFDAGDARLAVSALSGVWSVAVDAAGAVSQMHEEIVNVVGAANTSVAAIATPPRGSGSPALVVWAPALAAVPGSLIPPSPSSTIMACQVGASCQPLSPISTAPGQLAVSSDGQTVVAYTRTAVFVSRDSGRSFTSTAPPPGTVSVQSAVPMGSALWVSLTRADGTAGVSTTAGAHWVDATAGVDQLRMHLASLVAASPHRLMAVLADMGYRCTATDSAPAWSSRCPR